MRCLNSLLLAPFLLHLVFASIILAATDELRLLRSNERSGREGGREENWTIADWPAFRFRMLWFIQLRCASAIRTESSSVNLISTKPILTDSKTYVFSALHRKEASSSQVMFLKKLLFLCIDWKVLKILIHADRQNLYSFVVFRLINFSFLFEDNCRRLWRNLKTN